MLTEADRALIRRRLAGDLSKSEFESFDQRLIDDVGFRDAYVREADLEAALYEKLTQEPEVSRDRPKKRAQSFAAIVGAVAALSCLIGFATGRFSNWADRPVPDIEAKQGDRLVDRVEADNADAVDTPEPLDAPSAATFVSRVTAVGRPLAVVTLLEADASSELAVGDWLTSGDLSVGNGRLQIEFASGAVVALEGPADLRLVSTLEAELISGRATVRVPDRARGFVLNAPRLAVVDLGTEFAVEIEPSGESRVDVLEGEVEVSLLGEDGNTLISRRAEAATSLKVNKLLQELSEASRRDASPLRVTRLSIDRLNVPSQYSDAISESEPDFYWTFDSVGAAQEIKSSTPSYVRGVVLQPEAGEGTIGFSRDYASFDLYDGPRCIAASEPLSGLNGDEFTVEFWMNADSLAHATLLSLSPADDPIPWNHLLVIEIATNTHQVHQPGALRFLHRFPPAQKAELGKNAYSKSGIKPGLWQHVVAVKATDRIRLFLDGRLESEIPIASQDDDDSYSLFLGQLRREGFERQFVGGIDELAIYRRSLSETEVKSHYELMKSSSSDLVVLNSTGEGPPLAD